MYPDKETRITNSIMAGATVVFFITLLIFFENDFGNSFFKNFFMIIIMFIGSFLLGNIVIGIPIAIIYFITNYTFEEFYETSEKKRFLIIAIFIVIVSFIISIIVT